MVSVVLDFGGKKEEANQCKCVWLGSGEVRLASVRLPSTKNIYLSCILRFFLGPMDHQTQ